MSPLWPPALAFLVAAVATPALALWARRRGWIDRRDGTLARRKPRRAPVAPVGGVALLLALAAGSAAGDWGPGDWGLPWPALLAAAGLGLWDDRVPGGLGPRAKLAGQLVAAGLLAGGSGGTVAEGALLALVALVAMNAVNTYDNADGTATGLGLVGLPGLWVPWAALAGFLPWNLLVRRGDGGDGGERGERGKRGERGERGKRVPVAYLGDSGSHLVGLLMAANPAAWPVLTLPLADLARLCVVRARDGRPPWSGDRLHLAHRLEAAGAGPVAVALGLTLLAALPVLGAASLPGGPGLALGVGATLAGLALLVLRTPDPLPAAQP